MNFVKIFLITPVIGQLYLSIKLFNNNDSVGGIIFLGLAIAWSIVALNMDKIIK